MGDKTEIEIADQRIYNLYGAEHQKLATLVISSKEFSLWTSGLTVGSTHLQEVTDMLRAASDWIKTKANGKKTEG